MPYTFYSKGDKLKHLKSQNISVWHQKYPCFRAEMFEMCRLSAGVFVLLQVYAFLQYLKNRLTRHEFQTLFFLGVSVAAGVVFLSVIYLTYTGWFHTFTGPIKKTPKQDFTGEMVPAVVGEVRLIVGEIQLMATARSMKMS